MAEAIQPGAYEAMCGFETLYQAYRKARLGKSHKREVQLFDLDAGVHLFRLHHELAAGTYRMSAYRRFHVYEPKVREIRCLPFRDRIVQRSLCDNVLYPYFKDRLVYDNCACQKGKGTHFGLYRVNGFLRDFYNKHGTDGWILKGDITKYFYSIDCDKLKTMLRPRIWDERLWTLLEHIIDSGGDERGRGVPLGNQTSQWFSLFYLDPLDRLVKERLRIKWYSRYMDDFVLIHPDKAYLRECLRQITELVEELGLTLNPKTQIFPVKNGVDYLGFHLYLTETGKVIRKLRRASKTGMKRRLRFFQKQYAAGNMEWEDITQHLASWRGHAAHGHTYRLQEKICNEAVFVRNTTTSGQNVQKQNEEAIV